MRKQSERKEWFEIEEQGSLLGLGFLLLLYRVIGRPIVSLMLYPVVLYFFIFNGSSRRASMDYLAKVKSFYPENKCLSERLTLKHVFFHFMTFADALVDKVGAWLGDVSQKDIVFDDRDFVLSRMSGGKGAVIIGSHLGNMDMSRGVASSIPEAKLTVLMHTKHAGNFNKLISKASKDSNLDVIQVTEMSPATAVMLSERVENGEFIFIIADRVPVQSATRVSPRSFLGHEALFPQGPFVIAGLLKCPVYLMFCLKDGRSYKMYFEQFSDKLPFSKRERESTLDECVSRFVGRLEHYVNQAPLQWYNFFDFWQRGNELPESKK